MLLCTMSTFPQIVMAYFGTYAIIKAVKIHNTTPQEVKDKFPWKKITNE